MSDRLCNYTNITSVRECLEQPGDAVETAKGLPFRKCNDTELKVAKIAV